MYTNVLYRIVLFFIVIRLLSSITAFFHHCFLPSLLCQVQRCIWYVNAHCSDVYRRNVAEDMVHVRMILNVHAANACLWCARMPEDAATFMVRENDRKCSDAYGARE